MLSSGVLPLFMARIVSPSVEPTTTLKRGSALNCEHGLRRREIREGVDVAGHQRGEGGGRIGDELEGRLVERDRRRPSSPGSSPARRGRPCTQSTNLNGPVPTGWVALSAALSGATITASPQPMLNRKSPLRLRERDLRRSPGRPRRPRRCLRTAPSGRWWNRSARARSSENFTSSASKAVPSWNLTPVVQVEGVGQAVVGNVPAFGESGLHAAVAIDAGQALEDVGVDHLVDRRGGAARSGRGSAAPAPCRS